MIFVPLFEVVLISGAIILILGPIITALSGALAAGIVAIYKLSPAISGLIIGGFYQVLVIFGLHWAIIPIVVNDITTTGHSYLNAIVSATMVAQGGAVLAIALKSKFANIKELAWPATISAFCGVTEPAMYGINLKYGRAFITASIGGAVGGFLTGLFNVNMWGFAGSLIGFTSFFNPKGIDFSFYGFLIASAADLIVAFALTWMFGFSDNDVKNVKTAPKKKHLGQQVA
jgi:PTS system beta-glucosides-specific IIC component